MVKDSRKTLINLIFWAKGSGDWKMVNEFEIILIKRESMYEESLEGLSIMISLVHMNLECSRTLNDHNQYALL